MRKFSIILLFLFSCNIISFAQDASSYFPANPGFTWNYKVVPLDSANKEIDSLTYYRVDSFAVAQDYKGMSANIIVSKVRLSPNMPFTSLPDSTFIAFNGSDAYTYYKLFNIDSLLNSLGSSKVLSKATKVNDASGWLDYYRFSQTVNTSYQIYMLDTTVNYKGLNLQVRYIIDGIRMNDQSILTGAGSFNCKRFVIDNQVLVNLFGIYSPIFNISDTLWIAQNSWIVRDYMPSTIANPLNLGEIYIPGSIIEMISQIPTGVNEIPAQVNSFRLYQNYPNPFNPSTIIRYSVPENSNVELTVYDILGNKVTTLINKEQNAGNHEVEFIPSSINGGISSGVYFYTLKTGTGALTKKLIYLK